MPRRRSAKEQVQAMVYKPPFRRVLAEIPGVGKLYETRRRRWLITRSDEHGEGAVRPAHEQPAHPPDFPSVPWDKARRVIGEEGDYADFVPSFETADKEAASTIGVDVEENYRERGGTGKKVPKMGGWSSDSERKKMEEIRKEDGPNARSARRYVD